MKNILILCCVMVFLTGCQRTGLFLANLSNDQKTFTQQRDIAYGPNPWQKLDIYKPVNAPVPLPTIVFYYGGSWVGGDKNRYGFVANRLVREGFGVIIPDYVKYPDAVYPAFVEDAALVTKWLDQNLDEQGLDRNRLHLMGHSAGAHIGAMLIVDEQYLNAHELKPDFYQSFIGLAGPYDFTPGSRRYRAIFGPPERYPLMQASNFISGDEPPMLLMMAGNDWLVADSNTLKLTEAIQNKQGRVKTQRYENLGHMTLVGSFSDSFGFGAQVIDDITAFIEAVDQNR